MNRIQTCFPLKSSYSRCCFKLFLRISQISHENIGIFAKLNFWKKKLLYFEQNLFFLSNSKFYRLCKPFSLFNLTNSLRFVFHPWRNSLHFPWHFIEFLKLFMFTFSWNYLLFSKFVHKFTVEIIESKSVECQAHVFLRVSRCIDKLK